MLVELSTAVKYSMGPQNLFLWKFVLSAFSTWFKKKTHRNASNHYENTSTYLNASCPSISWISGTFHFWAKIFPKGPPFELLKSRNKFLLKIRQNPNFRVFKKNPETSSEQSQSGVKHSHTSINTIPQHIDVVWSGLVTFLGSVTERDIGRPYGRTDATWFYTKRLPSVAIIYNKW